MPIEEFIRGNEYGLFGRLDADLRFNMYNVLYAQDTEQIFEKYPETLGMWFRNAIANFVELEMQVSPTRSLLEKYPFIIRLPQVLAKLADIRMDIRYVSNFPGCTYWLFLNGFITKDSVIHICSQRVAVPMLCLNDIIIPALSIIYEMLKKYDLQGEYFPNDVIAGDYFEKKWPPQLIMRPPENSPQLIALALQQTEIANFQENNIH
ncbi:hypothetical protein KDA11_04850 [Candidatus Saccharibacteria bacterium]|nr:hypothetical protein [Candidatus Saccharibacteria bacterium]